jgi:hypothetical protein
VLGRGWEESMVEKGHGVADDICFECGSVAWGKKKRRRGAYGCVHVEGEGGSERVPSMAVGSVGQPAVTPGHRAHVALLSHEQGRAVAMGERR